MPHRINVSLAIEVDGQPFDGSSFIWRVTVDTLQSFTANLTITANEVVMVVGEALAQHWAQTWVALSHGLLRRTLMLPVVANKALYHLPPLGLKPEVL